MVGGTSGLGYSACLALANDPKVSKVVLTSRSAASAERAINSLSASSKKPKGEFESVLLDLEDLGSIQAAVASFPPFDVICLSAGGLAKTGKSAHQHTESGVTHSVLINALGIATRGWTSQDRKDQGRIPRCPNRKRGQSCFMLVDGFSANDQDVLLEEARH